MGNSMVIFHLGVGLKGYVLTKDYDNGTKFFVMLSKKQAFFDFKEREKSVYVLQVGGK